MIGTSANNRNKAQLVIEKFYVQLTSGCGTNNCSNKNCASNPNFKKLSNNDAAVLALQLAQTRETLCEPLSESVKKMETNEKDDNDDIVTSKTTSMVNLRASSATSCKNLVQSLEEALKAVSSNSETNFETEYLNEKKLTALIQKCKENYSKLKSEKMETDSDNDKSDLLKCYEPLFEIIKNVFTSYKSLALSFQFDKDNIQMSSSIPTTPPFNIDFNSIRRSISSLFSINGLTDELEDTLDQSIYPLCVSIQMQLKKQNVDEEQMNKILHSLLIVNEIPLLENPGYMDKCTKAFYSVLKELPPGAMAKIVRLWSNWSADELKILLYKTHQYITLEVVTKNLDLPNDDDEDDDEDENESSNKKAIYKNESLIGAVNYIKLIYYASIYGGRLDPEEQIKKEKEIEEEENQNLEGNRDENAFFGDSSSDITYLTDPIEKILNIRPIDCREPKIPYNDFINETINKFIDVQYDYVEYTKQMQYQELILEGHEPSSKVKKTYFSFLSNPFFVVLTKKNLGLFYDNKIKMMRERRNNIMLSILEGRMPNPYFKIQLSRQNILAEALNLIELQEQENPATLRKQLFIEFENEQGIDQGGISKEFFQLAIDELLNKGYTFFKYDEKSKYYWFTPCTIESKQEFRLVGILFGIAIYNNVLLDSQFPPVFFRKLLGKIGTFEDLMYSHPDLFQGLKSLLEFQGTDQEFEDTFMQTFQISITDNFGTVVNFNLKENGDNIPVTKENRQEFCDLYADFMLNKGIDESFKAFKRGFMKLTQNSPLSRWFTPEELEILLCGTTVLDWKSLEKSTAYDSGFDEHSKYIKDFWSVFEEFSDEQKKLFLKFTTGTDRCPHGGLSELKLTIARNGPDSDKLPTAHTCFNVLLLPEYSSKQKLKEKLLKAIQYSRGFGLS